MRLTVRAILTGALLLWRRDADLIVRVAGPFLFLPTFALQLFLPLPTPAPDGTLVATAQRQGEFLSSHAVPFLAELALLQFGAGVLVVLYCDPERPTLGTAMARAGRLLPRFLLAALLVALPARLGLVLLIVPGLLVMARTMLTGPFLVAHAPLGAAAAVGRSVRGTAGQTAPLAAAAALCWGAELLGGEPLRAVGNWLRAMPDANPVAVAIADAAFAAWSAAVAVAGVLLAVSAYRLLSPSKGI
jgi:hypothetical protein